MIKEWVVNWFLENAESTGDIDLSINYIDESLIDSFGFINLIADIEEKFDIKFSDQDFENPDFMTINGLINRIDELTK